MSTRCFRYQRCDAKFCVKLGKLSRTQKFHYSGLQGICTLKKKTTVKLKFAVFFLYFNGVVYFEFLAEGQQLCEKIRKKRPELWRHNLWFIHYEKVTWLFFHNLPTFQTWLFAIPFYSCNWNPCWKWHKKRERNYTLVYLANKSHKDISKTNMKLIYQ